MSNKWTAKQLYELSHDEFREFYESSQYQSFLDYVESRMRLEIISLIRFFDLKGVVFFELRKKSSLSAYNKIQKEIAARSLELGESELELQDIIKDIIGCRIICNDEKIIESVLRLILQVENIEIQEEGAEYYAAPYRQVGEGDEKYKSLSQIFANSSGIDRELAQEVKKSNYESLHFYANFSSPYDQFQESPTYHLLESEGDEGRRRRDRTEKEYISDLWGNLDDNFRKLSSRFPVEFQIRSITEHLWAAEEHKFVYGQMKQGLKGISEDDFDLLKQAFIGLKYAYRNIDDLRSLIRKIASKPLARNVAYSGGSKDINQIRLRYFDKSESDISNIFVEIDRDVFSLLRNTGSLGEFENDNLISIFQKISNLHTMLVAASPDGKIFNETNFAIEKWGRARVFMLLIAYILLFSGGKSLSPQVRRYIEQYGLTKVIGKQSLKLAEQRDDGSLFLASRFYERIRSFDEFAISLIGEGGGEDRPNVFLDPLVGIRHASSLFLQSEFAGARQALERVFRMKKVANIDDWSDLDLSGDFSPAEIYMRHSQYVWFEYFEDAGGLLDKFHLIEDVFERLFHLKSDEFDQDTYRAYCWYWCVYSYLKTMKLYLPGDFLKHTTDCLSYLKRYSSNAFGDGDPALSQKIEVRLAAVSLSDDLDSVGSYANNVKLFSQLISEFHSYPSKAIQVFEIMFRGSMAAQGNSIGKSKPYTFISYVHENSDIVEDIAQHLTTNGIAVKYDRDFSSGSSLISNVERIMDRAQSAIIVVSKEYLESDGWVKEERAYLMERRRKDNLKIYIIASDISSSDILRSAPLMSDILRENFNPEEIAKSLNSIVEAIKSDLDKL